MDYIQGWGSESISCAMKTMVTAFTGIFSLLLAYLLWAAADCWVLHRGRKGPFQWPILGVTVEALKNYQTLNDWVVYYFLRDGLTFSSKMLHMDLTFTADPANVKHILKTNFANYDKGLFFHEIFEIFLGDGIFNADGEIWRKQRKTASFEFASRKLRDFSTAVYRDYSVKLATILTQAADAQQSMDMQDLFMRFTLDSIFKVTFDYEIGTLQPGLPNIPFAEAFETTNEITSSRIVNPIWKLNRALNIGSERVLVKSAKDVDNFIYGVIKAKKAEMANSKTDLLSGKSDLFTRFMRLSEESDCDIQFTDKNFRDTLLNFIIAGRDTTAVSLSWFVYRLAQHPDKTDKLRQELRDFDTVRNWNRQPESEEGFRRRVLEFAELLTFDTLVELQYLHACILETLRLHPAVPMDPKHVINDDTLPDGTRVKRGSMVYYTPYAMGRMPALWGPDALEFKPERWFVDGVVRTEPPFKFTAFQAGPRICLGKDSAMLQLRMVLALLYRFFTFQIVEGSVIRYRQMATLLLANGLPVKIIKQTN